MLRESASTHRRNRERRLRLRFVLVVHAFRRRVRPFQIRRVDSCRGKPGMSHFCESVIERGGRPTCDRDIFEMISETHRLRVSIVAQRCVPVPCPQSCKSEDGWRHATWVILNTLPNRRGAVSTDRSHSHVRLSTDSPCRTKVTMTGAIGNVERGVLGRESESRWELRTRRVCYCEDTVR